MMVDAMTPATGVLHVLVVEDSFLTARTLAKLIEGFGAEVVGPVPTVRRALGLLNDGGCNAAILDVNLGSETVEPVAQKLLDLGLPFFFVSGYSSPKLLSSRFKGWPLVPKPVDPVLLQRMFIEKFRPPDAGSPVPFAPDA